MKARKLAKQGRPPKPGPREGNGRLQRMYDEEAKRAKKEAVTSVVLLQPHRKGSDDPRRYWAIGRLILDGKVTHREFAPGVLQRAAARFAQDYANLRWVIDSRRPWWNGGASGNRDEPTPEERREIEREWGNARRAVLDCGVRVLKALEFVVLDNPDHEAVLAPWIILSLPEGLGALVTHYELDK